MRLTETRAGAILLDGRDCRTVPLQSLRRSVGVVPQTPFLFQVRHWYGTAAQWADMKACKFNASEIGLLPPRAICQEQGNSIVEVLRFTLCSRVSVQKPMKLVCA